MPNDSYTQNALADEPKFRARVRAQMSAVAWQIQGEDASTPNHTARETYAKQVVRNLDAETAVIMPSFVMRPNVNNFATTYNFNFQTRVGFVESATTDADIASQLATDWDMMAAASAGPALPPAPPPIVPAAR